MKRTYLLPLLSVLCLFYPRMISAQAPAGYTLSWSDEFDGTSLDQNNWNVETGSFYWANQEQQYYTHDAITVGGGSLKVTARWDASDNRIESGRINSKDKRELGDGYYEARVRFTGTYHNSIFAAFWSMGYRHEDPTYPAHALPSGNAWPSCGENDFMEWVGSDDDRDQANGTDDGLYTPMAACHFNPNANNSNTNSNGQSGWPHNWVYETHYGNAGDLDPYAWHTVGAEIDGGTCTYYFNGIPYKTYNIGAQTELMEDRFLICNFAIGGTLSDPFTPESSLPTTVMEWDYVRFYTKQNTPIPTIPSKVEAEGYGRMNGIQVEPCSAGGQNIGYFDVGDWFTLDINVPVAGTYQLACHVASVSGGNILVEKDAGATLLGTVNVPATGGWQTWTVAPSINITLPAGQQTLGFATSTGGVNVDWVEFKGSVPTRVEAEAFSVQSGIQIVNSTVSYVGYVDAGDYTTYEPLTLPGGPGSYDITFQVASPANNTSFQLERAGGGATYTTVNVPNTGAWEHFTSVTQQNVYLPDGTANYALAFHTGSINIDYMEFVKVGNPRLGEATQTAISLHPNPAIDQVVISGLPTDLTQLHILDVWGHTLQILPLADEEVLKADISALLPGIYWLVSQGTLEPSSLKFIKQ